MELTRQISEFTDKGINGLGEEDRYALLQASHKLSRALETPFEKVGEMVTNIYDPIAVRIAIDLKLVDIAIEQGGTITLQELAERSKADLALIERLIRILVPLDVFRESGPGKISTTSFTSKLATGSPFTGLVIHLTHMYHSVASFPEYFVANGYKNPEDARYGPFSFAFGCEGKTYFDWLSKPENTRLAQAFNSAMELQKARDDISFVETYPAQERLKNDDPERVLLVDVGGNMGHQVRLFQKRYPSSIGKLVLEDLPQVVDRAVDVPSSIIKVGHDFFTPQPNLVKNAKAFYLKTIIHDWPDIQARNILTNIVDAMADDSVILMHEIVLPTTGVRHFDAKVDFHMVNLAACERTEKQWKELGESVGLKINGIWRENEGLYQRAMIEFGKKIE